jgi:hypothetical protein
MKKHIIYLLALSMVLIYGCQKEVSFEAGKNPSNGSLQDDGTGDCLPKTVNGVYVAGTALAPATNTITVDIDVTKAGSYTVTSDTINGYYFRATGTFAATGINSVTLKGNGTPIAAGTNNFVISYDSSICVVAVTVLPAGAGGPAVFTLGGAPGACTPFVIGGVYVQGTALNAADTVQITVTVTTIGVYNITTNTVDGFSFAASGSFSATGVQTVKLTGTGTPTNTGVQTFTVTAGSSSCTFQITVVPIDYFPRTANSNWSYEYDDDPDDTLYRKAITPTLSAMGNTYNIFMEDYGVGLDSSGYFRKSGTDYFEYFDAGGFIGYDDPQWAEYIFLKDAAAGTTWNSSAGGYTGNVTVAPNPTQSLTIRFKYTILQKDVPISLTTSKGVANYTNVIVVEEKYEQFSAGVWIDVTSVVGYGKSYYARGIGLIKYESFDGTGALNYQQELRRYQVF